MAKNLIPEICKLLGVEVGEEFRICDEDMECACEYYIDESGTVCEAPYSEENEPAYGIEFDDLLTGRLEIVKLPWKPKLEENYWTFNYDTDIVSNNLLVT